MEGPEYGIHPMPIATMYQSLASVYDSQMFVAIHSPVLLKSAEPDETLCFAKSEDSATDIILCSRHSRLEYWKTFAGLNQLSDSEVLG